MPAAHVRPSLSADTAAFALGKGSSSQSSPCSRPSLREGPCAWLRVAPGAPLPSALFGGPHDVRATDGRVPPAEVSAHVQVAHDNVIEEGAM